MIPQLVLSNITPPRHQARKKKAATDETNNHTTIHSLATKTGETNTKNTNSTLPKTQQTAKTATTTIDSLPSHTSTVETSNNATNNASSSTSFLTAAAAAAAAAETKTTTANNNKTSLGPSITGAEVNTTATTTTKTNTANYNNKTSLGPGITSTEVNTTTTTTTKTNTTNNNNKTSLGPGITGSEVKTTTPLHAKPLPPETNNSNTRPTTTTKTNTSNKNLLGPSIDANVNTSTPPNTAEANEKTNTSFTRPTTTEMVTKTPDGLPATNNKTLPGTYTTCENKATSECLTRLETVTEDVIRNRIKSPTTQYEGLDTRLAKLNQISQGTRDQLLLGKGQVQFWNSSSTAPPQSAKRLADADATEEVNYVKDINDFDVLFGRGGKTNHHYGNMFYRRLIAEQKPVYKNCNRNEKKLLSLNIVDAIRETHNGRFLALDKACGKYYVVNKSVAREKVSQALRENAQPEFPITLDPKQVAIALDPKQVAITLKTKEAK